MMLDQKSKIFLLSRQWRVSKRNTLRLTVTLSHYLLVPLLSCPITILYHYHLVPLQPPLPLVQLPSGPITMLSLLCCHYHIVITILSHYHLDPLPSCLISILSYYHLVPLLLSHYHLVPLPPCQTNTLSHYHLVPLPPWDLVIPTTTLSD